MAKVNLGDTVKDTVTGFHGVAIARTIWLHGCDRIMVQPAVDKDGKLPEPSTFDELQLEVLQKKSVAGTKTTATKTGGGGRNDKAAQKR